MQLCVSSRNVIGSVVKGSGQHLFQSGTQDVNVPIQLYMEGVSGWWGYICILYVLLFCMTSVSP